MLFSFSFFLSLSLSPFSGMFVSESKFLSSPSSFLEPIRSKNRQALEDLITKPEVEAKLLIRLAEKAKVYGQDLDKTFILMQGGSKDGVGELKSKIEVEEVVRLYKTFVIPLTKVVEVSFRERRRGEKVKITDSDSPIFLSPSWVKSRKVDYLIGR